MNKRIKSILQLIISLALGVFLIWYIYKDLTEADKANMMSSVKDANYWWIAASSVIAIISHLFRAHRWKYPLESMHIHVNLSNRFAAVMVGYLANLAFPRLGEVSRCAVLTRYQKHPFEKLFGTVIAERVVDALILLALIFLAVVLQFDILRDMLQNAFGRMVPGAQSMVLITVLGIVGLAIAFVVWKFISRSTHHIALRIKDKIMGLAEGMASIMRMKGKAWFYFDTLMIWGCYVMMFVLTFKSLPETAVVPFGGMLASFVLGGLSIVAVQGGLGAYPLAIMMILALYGVDKNIGYAFGWIVWSAQTVLIILVGFLSVLALPLINNSEASTQE